MLKMLFWALVVAALGIGAWQLYLRHQRETMFAGTVYYRDGQPLETGGQVAPPPALHQPQPPQPSASSNETSAAPPAAAPAAATTVSGTKTAAHAGFTPTPPTGVSFAAAGGFQWYRQGDITWRLNLDSGASCVAFATPEAWQKPDIFRHGCSPA